MSRAVDRIVRTCELLADEDDRRYNRCLVALRRSGRDVTFNGYIGWRRLRLEVAKPVVKVLDFLAPRYLKVLFDILKGTVRQFN